MPELHENTQIPDSAQPFVARLIDRSSRVHWLEVAFVAYRLLNGRVIDESAALSGAAATVYRIINEQRRSARMALTSAVREQLRVEWGRGQTPIAEYRDILRFAADVEHVTVRDLAGLGTPHEVAVLLAACQRDRQEAERDAA